MKLTKILAIVGLVAVVAGALWWFGGGRDADPLQGVTDLVPLTEEYPGLPEGHTFVRESGEETIERFRSGDGIIFLGFKECPWCQKLAPILNEAAMLEGEAVYYYDIRSEREGDTATYQELVSILEPYLAKDENGEPRIYVPDVSFVRGGEIVWRFEMEEAGEEERTPDTYWTRERHEQAVEIFREQIRNLQSDEEESFSHITHDDYDYYEAVCHESEKYFVATYKHFEVGENRVLVKYKNSPSDQFDCEYVAGANDYEIGNSAFIRLTDDYILVTENAYAGMGNLVAYSLEQKKPVFTDRYVNLSSVENGEAVGGAVTYLSVIDMEPTTEVCQEFESIRASGLDIIVLSEVTVNLGSGEVYSSGVLSCDGVM